LTNTDTSIIDFIIDVEGIYKFELVVNDKETDSKPTLHSMTVSCPNPEPPIGISATDSIYSDRILISWQVSNGAKEYRVYRK
jgi:hypothetical protein